MFGSLTSKNSWTHFCVALQELENNFWLSSTSITKNPGVENVGGLDLSAIQADRKFPSSTIVNFHPAFSSVCKHSLNCPKQAETPKWGWAVFFRDPKIFLFTTHPPHLGQGVVSSFSLHSNKARGFLTRRLLKGFKKIVRNQGYGWKYVIILEQILHRTYWLLTGKLSTNDVSVQANTFWGAVLGMVNASLADPFFNTPVDYASKSWPSKELDSLGP